MKYFEGITDTEEAKKRFKELAKQYHPDKEGDVEVMKEINSQYDLVMQGIYQKSGKSITEIEDLLKDMHEVRDRLWKISALPGIVIELCGDWLWITGDTKSVKDILKGSDFKWACKKKAWYWRKEGIKCRQRGSISLDEIRLKYGSSKIDGIKKTLVA